jgi:hypothetical protein
MFIKNVLHILVYYYSEYILGIHFTHPYLLSANESWRMGYKEVLS